MNVYFCVCADTEKLATLLKDGYDADADQKNIRDTQAGARTDKEAATPIKAPPVQAGPEIQTTDGGRQLMADLAEQAARDRAQHAEACRKEKEQANKTGGLLSTVLCPENEPANATPSTNTSTSAQPTVEPKDGDLVCSLEDTAHNHIAYRFNTEGAQIVQTKFSKNGHDFDTNQEVWSWGAAGLESHAAPGWHIDISRFINAKAMATLMHNQKIIAVGACSRMIAQN